MICIYPNLELIEYKFKEILKKSEVWVERRNSLLEKRFAPPIEFDIQVFSQVWGSTCTAFDIDREGKACIGGCAMTKAYTTVIEEEGTELYGVFVGNEFCYLVSNPNKKFFEDLHDRNMASVSESKNRY